MNTPKLYDHSSIVEELSEKYANVLGTNFERKEQELIKQLFEQAKVLKEQITYFKRETSAQNIERLVTERRREKEKERQYLETRWRQCTQSFKKLQEQQKRLTEQHRENEFDLKNLQNKIKQFEKKIDKIKEKAKKQNIESNNHFITEVKQNYRSPYKACESVQEKMFERLQKEKKLLMRTQEHFFSKKYNIDLNDSMTPISDFSNQKLPKQSHHRLLKSFNSATEKWKRSDRFDEGSFTSLRQFLNNREVRIKIFKFLKKQI